MSLSDLITSPEVKDKLKRAELAEKDGDIGEALGASAEAVELAASALVARLQLRGPEIIPTQLLESLGQQGAFELARYMRSYLETANRSALTLALSLDLNEVLRVQSDSAVFAMAWGWRIREESASGRGKVEHLRCNVCGGFCNAICPCC